MKQFRNQDNFINRVAESPTPEVSRGQHLGREFETKEELEKVVNQLLNEGRLSINWSRKLKNKGNVVNVV